MNRKKINKILEDHGDWLLVDISTPTFPDVTMACDKDAFKAHTGGRIYAFKKKLRSKYIYARYCVIIDGKRCQSYFHQDVIEIPKGKSCDHIIHGTLDYIDNRRSNLRVATVSQNCMNQTIKANNTSGIKGVYWHNLSNKWVARISVRGKRIHLGYYDNIIFAIGARQQAEREYHGEFAYNA